MNQEDFQFYFSRFCKETIAATGVTLARFMFYFSRFCKETIAILDTVFF